LGLLQPHLQFSALSATLGRHGYLNQKGITNGLILSLQGVLPTWMGSGHINVGSEDEWAEMVASLLYYARNTQHLQFSVVDRQTNRTFSRRASRSPVAPANT